jgi:hypothetical protein
MNQLQFNFFWPLTEQIPLDLDYTDCAKPQVSTPIINGIYALHNGGTAYTTITASHLTIDSETTTIKVKDKPNIIRRGLLNAIGLKWELK